MKRLLIVAYFLSIPAFLSAQIHTDEVNVTEGLNGNVGIGVNTTNYKLQVEGSTEILSTGTGAGFRFRDRDATSQDNDWVWYSVGGTARLWRATAEDPLVVKSNGRVGIGTTNPGVYSLSGNTTSFSAIFDVDGEAIAEKGYRVVRGTSYGGEIDHPVMTYSVNQNARNTASPTGWAVRAQSAAGGETPMKLSFFSGYSTSFNTNNALLDALDSSPTLVLFARHNDQNQYKPRFRAVGINTSNPSYNLDVNGSIRYTSNASSSDYRWKKDIVPISEASAILAALRPVSYYWKTGEYQDKNFDSRRHYGLIAQELEKVLPDLVDADNEGYKSADYIGLIGILIKGFQEQQQEMEQLRKEIEILKDQLPKSE